MAEHEHTLAERLELQRQRSIDAIAANDASEQSTTPKKKKKKKKKAKEAVGTGTPSFDLEGAVAKIRAQIAATQDPDLKARLKARIAALKQNAG